MIRAETQTDLIRVDDGVQGPQGPKGDDGDTPVITATKSGTTTTIEVDGTSIATINDGAQGPQQGRDAQDPGGR